MEKVLFWDFDGTLASNNFMFSKALYKILKNYEPSTDIILDDLKKKAMIGFP